MTQLYSGLILNNRYQIQHPIGRGGFSIVWLAVDKRESKTVAIKVSVPEKDLKREMALRYEHEYQSTRRLLHPNLLCAIDYFKYGNSGCLVFEYMANGTLQNYIKTHGCLPETEIAKVMQQIGSGLDCLHKRHFVHFGIKPEKILINTKGEYALADFDRTSRLRNAVVRTERIYADTPQYRSPEQLLGASELSEKVDIFAFGTALFELCNGLIEKDGGIAKNMIAGFEKPIFNSGTDVYSERLLQIIHACWNYNPVDRPCAATLLEYAQCLLKKGYWPNIIEYKPDDHFYSAAPLATTNGIARVAVTIPLSREITPITDNQSLLTVESSKKHLVQGSAKTLPMPKQYFPLESVPQSTDVIAKKEEGIPLKKSEIWTSEKLKGRSPLFTLPIRNKEEISVSIKAAIAGVAALLLVAVSLLFLNARKNKFQEYVDNAKVFLKENRLKPALEAIKTAKKMNGDSPEITAVRRAIFQAALAQHSEHLAKVRKYVASKNADNYVMARRILTDNAENASILIAQDSTSFYLNLIPE